MLKFDKSLLTHFRISYARSSGKGGQHVNTTSSKAQLKLTPQDWINGRGQWMSRESWDNVMKNYKDRAPLKTFKHFTPKMGVLISSDTSRVRDENLMECLERFCNEFNKCCQLKQQVSEDTRKHWDKLKKRDNEMRLGDKKKRKDVKRSRGKIQLD